MFQLFRDRSFFRADPVSNPAGRINKKVWDRIGPALVPGPISREGPSIDSLPSLDEWQ